MFGGRFWVCKSQRLSKKELDMHSCPSFPNFIDVFELFIKSFLV